MNPDFKKKFKFGPTITQEQHDFYQKYGFLIFEKVFNDETIAAIHRELDEQKTKIAESGLMTKNGVPIKYGVDEKNQIIPQRTPFMNQFSPFIDKLVRDPLLQPLLEFIPGSRFGLEERDGVVINHYVRSKKSRFTKLGWHIDSMRDLFYLEKIRPMLNVGIQISHSSEKLGGLRLVPGSHNQSLLSMLFGKLHIISNKPDPNEVAVNVEPGDLTIHDGRLWHRAAGPAEAMGVYRKTIYFPILCGPYKPKTESSKPPVYLRLWRNAKPNVSIPFKNVVVTGASQGIGRSLAESFAKRGANVVLVARNEAKLREVAAQLEKKHHVKTWVFPLDLSQPDAAKALRTFCENNQIEIDTLVNNAGYGIWGKFSELTLKEQLDSIQVNLTSVIQLTHEFTPLLVDARKKHGKAYVLNVSSTTAYQAIPTFSTYAAAKSAILSFSRAIHHELKPDGIVVTALVPGATESGFIDRANMQHTAEKAKKVSMTPDRVAEIGVKGLLRGKIEVIAGSLNVIMAGATRVLPKRTLETAAQGIYRKES